jgi:RimJ/RimL family protein N-acetyltransferase
MKPREYRLKNGEVLVIREAEIEDARDLIEYAEATSGESDNLTFGSGEFDISLSQEEEIIRNSRGADNILYIIGVVQNRIAAFLMFIGGKRPRLRHRGEFGISVRKAYWNLGIGSHMLDTMIEWAKNSSVVTKINLRVRCDNELAIGLYERKGFVKEGKIRRDMRIGKDYVDCYYMGLEIQDTTDLVRAGG